MRILSALGLLLAAILFLPKAGAEDGHELWLRYRLVEGEWLASYRQAITEVVSVVPPPVSSSPPPDNATRTRATALPRSRGGTTTTTLDVAQAELIRGLTGLLGASPPLVAEPSRGGSLILGTPQSSHVIASMQLDLRAAGSEGYRIRNLDYRGRRVTIIAAPTDIGVLYGVFHYLRLLQTRQPIDHLDLLSTPRLAHRILNHWDNLDRTVERGYAGESIWDWQKLPDYLDPRYTDYARACASLGINGTVPTNVNPSPFGLTPEYLRKYAALANIFRPYGIRIYLTARFSAPMEIGGLKTADPLDPAVRAWWRAKIDAIYALIPDFGGFLVKANSEGQPGPQDYSRTHADGANMLAEAIAPHNGLIIWRAFVYSQQQPEDRAKQAYSEFVPLDGQFRSNVLLQVKNGPIDFQPREPFHPLFGAMPRTPLLLEVQITKEYLGFATHLVYLGPLFEETLRSDTYTRGKGSTVDSLIAGMAGVANVGSDRNWTGSHFDQANWYVFGRLAWNPGLSSRDIAAEWVKMTFSSDPACIKPMVGMMMGSREAAVDYMTPLGLHHQMARTGHYGPGPWVSGGTRADWTSVYYNRADSSGIGFDRTVSGSNAVAQYAPPVAHEFADLGQVPDRLLLWFHHVPWDYRMSSGRTLWDELVTHYSQGVQTVANMRKTWGGLADCVDAERYAQVNSFLAIQQNEAQWWRDASVAYFQSISKRPLPAGYAPPQHDLSYYESLCFPYVPGSAGSTEDCLKKLNRPQ